METAEGDRVCSINLDQIQNHPASDIATTLHHCLCSFPSIQPIFCPPSDAPTLSQECDNSSLCAIDQFIDMELYLSLIAATSDQQFSCLKSIPNIAINELDGHQDRLDHICCFFRNLLTSPFIRNSLGTSFARICPSDTDCRTRFDLNCCLPAILMEYELSFQFFHSMHSNGILSQVSVSIESVEYLCMNMIRQILRVSNGEFIDIFPAHQIMTLYIDPIISVICHLTLPSYSTVDRLIRSVAKLVSTIESHSPIVVMVSVTSILTHLYNYPDVFIRSMSAHIESCTSIYRMEDLSTIKNGVKLDSQAGPVVDDCATLWCSPDSDSLSWEGQISRYTHELLLALLDMMNSHGDSVGSAFGNFVDDHDIHETTVDTTNVDPLSHSYVLLPVIDQALDQYLICVRSISEINDSNPYMVHNICVVISSLYFLERFMNRTTYIYVRSVKRSDIPELFPRSSIIASVMSQYMLSFACSISNLFVCDILPSLDHGTWSHQRNMPYPVKGISSALLSWNLIIRSLHYDLHIKCPAIIANLIVSNVVYRSGSHLLSQYWSLTPSRAMSQQFQVDLGFIILMMRSVYIYLNSFLRSSTNSIPYIHTLSSQLRALSDLIDRFLSFLAVHISPLNLMLETALSGPPAPDLVRARSYAGALWLPSPLVYLVPRPSPSLTPLFTQAVISPPFIPYNQMFMIGPDRLSLPALTQTLSCIDRLSLLQSTCSNESYQAMLLHPSMRLDDYPRLPAEQEKLARELHDFLNASKHENESE